MVATMAWDVASATSVALAATAIPAGETIATRVGSWMRWREDEGGPRRWSWRMAGMGLACVAAIAIALPPRDAALASWGMAVAWYMATLDAKERWVADHGIIALLLAGLEMSPFSTLADRVHGAMLCGAIAQCLLILRTVRSRRAIGWDGLSGGDMWFPIGMGAWLGVGDGLLAMCAYVVIETAATATLVARHPTGDAPVGTIEAAVGYDRTTDMVPAVPYMALAMCFAMCAGRALAR